MIKTIKALGLLLIAAGLFTSCNFLNSATNSTSSTSSKPNLTEALFDASELTADAAKVELSKGSWTLRTITKKGDDTGGQQIDFKVNNKNKIESYYTYKIFTNGEYQEYTSTQMKNNSDKDEYQALILISGLQLAALEMSPSYDGCKTNSGKTKYYWTTQDSKGVPTNYYLAKK